MEYTISCQSVRTKLKTKKLEKGIHPFLPVSPYKTKKKHMAKAIISFLLTSRHKTITKNEMNIYWLTSHYVQKARNNRAPLRY